MVPSPCHDDVDVSLVVGTSHQHRNPHGPHREGYKHKHTQTHTVGLQDLKGSPSGLTSVRSKKISRINLVSEVKEVKTIF